MGTAAQTSLLRRLGLGPLSLTGWRRWSALSAVVALTLVTQVGVILWPVFGMFRGRGAGWRRLAVGVAMYALACAALVPPVAAVLGRVPLPCAGGSLRARSWLYCAANRRYVAPELRAAAREIADSVAAENPGTYVSYLDGAFPFRGLPLLPHLSHGDGRKLDLALFYVDRAGRPLEVGGSPVGYFGYVQPARSGDAACPQRWFDLRWDLAALQRWLMPDALDRGRTRRLVATAARHPAIAKGLIEPHLQRTLGVRSAKLRFQGCGAARHDDHVHLQLR
ncbi:MAG: hypothetical protein JWM10_4923 [Myxococcaceae bacterium]|nr:hypothetical protein [Myxococcaceae bacterium]